MDDEDEAVPFGTLSDRGAPRFLLSYGLGEELLPLLRFSPQLVPVSLCFSVAGPILPAPLFYVAFGPMPDLLNSREELLTMFESPLAATPVQSI